jgi:hypothetical protein
LYLTSKIREKCIAYNSQSEFKKYLQWPILVKSPALHFEPILWSSLTHKGF